MPYKHNADRRHHTLLRVLSRPKMSFKVQNWPAYEAGLRRRGSLTLWIEDAALQCWQTIGPGGQARYGGAAILTSLMLRTAFKLALRQTEGLMTSVLERFYSDRKRAIGLLPRHGPACPGHLFPHVPR